jgi:hypothetical protein
MDESVVVVEQARNVSCAMNDSHDLNLPGINSIENDVSADRRRAQTFLEFIGWKTQMRRFSQFRTLLFQPLYELCRHLAVAGDVAADLLQVFPGQR